jgi:dynein assembly factor 3
VGTRRYTNHPHPPQHQLVTNPSRRRFRPAMAALQGMGSAVFWGFTPAVDLQAATGSAAAAPAEDEPLRILVAGEGDARNILKTIALHRRHTARKLEFYVVERRLEHTARQMLLFHIAMDESLPLRERELLFLEVFGNCLLRGKTADYVESAAAELISLVTAGGAKWDGVLRVDSMKHKERDELEDVFKTWSQSVPFDIEHYRDERLRVLYGTRYDSRKNVLDWDYHMKMVKMASVIHPWEYRDWRQLGNAFTIRDRLVNLPDATVPNRTLAASDERRERGRSVLRRGFWGDIMNSPYVAFGVECNEPKLFAIANRSHKHNSQDVSEYSVISMLHELESGERVESMEKAIALGATGISNEPLPEPEPEPEPEGQSPEAVEEGTTLEDVTDSQTELEPEPEPEPKQEPEPKADEGILKGVLEAAGVTLHFMHGSVETALKKAKYKNTFDLAYVSSSYAHEISHEVLQGTLKPGSRFITETCRFVLELTPEQRQAYEQKVSELCVAAGWERQAPPARNETESAGFEAKLSSLESINSGKVEDEDLKACQGDDHLYFQVPIAKG